MSLKTYTSVLQVKVGGAELPPRLADLLVEAWVDASVNVPAAFRLAFSNPGGDLLKTFSVLAVGAKTELIPIVDGRPAKPLITGEITGVEVDVDAAGRSVVVRGYDPGHRLLRNRRVAGFPNQNASEIVRRVAQQNGLALARSTRPRPSTNWPPSRTSLTGISFRGWRGRTTSICTSIGSASCSSLPCARLRGRRARAPRPNRVRSCSSSVPIRSMDVSGSPPVGR